MAFIQTLPTQPGPQINPGLAPGHPLLAGSQPGQTLGGQMAPQIFPPSQPGPQINPGLAPGHPALTGAQPLPPDVLSPFPGQTQPGPQINPGLAPGVPAFSDPNAGLVIPGPQNFPLGSGPAIPGTGGLNVGQQSQSFPPTGLLGAEAALQGGLSGALSGIGAGIGSSNALLSPFTQGGQSAFNLQSALSGALGPAAQQQAFSNFTASPGQQFLTDAAEQSLLRNQAAVGGLGGGNVLSALQDQAIGLAQQDFGNQFSQLGQLAGLGAQTAGQQAGLNFAGGQSIADLAFGTGQSLASGRTRAGELIANQIGGTTSALSNLVSQQGTGLADLLGAGGGNLADILAGAGQTQSQGLQQLAALLANISTGQGSQIAGLPSIPGTQQATGTLGNIGNFITALGTL